MKKIKWVICDLDGTLIRYVNHVHVIEKEAIEAINKLIERKIMFTIATGRKYMDAIGIYENYGLQDKCNYIIACNGAIIYDTKNKQIIKKEVMDEKRLKITEAIAKKYANDVFIIASYRVDGSIVFTKEAKKHEKLVTEFLNYEGDFSKNNYSFSEHFSQEKDLLKAMFFFERNQHNTTRFLEIYNDISQTYKFDPTELVVTLPMTFELNPQGVSKGSAVVALSKILNIDLENALSIGDAGNDVSMFEQTKYSVTLESSDKKVKEKATYVLDASASLVVADAINLLVLDKEK